MTACHPIALGRTLAEKTPLGFGAGSAAAAGELITDESDAGLVTIAGTGAGKGVSQVIPTDLTCPGSMVIEDVKGEIYSVTARARRAMGQKVIKLDPFGPLIEALKPMKAVDPLSVDAYDQCKRLARLIGPGHARARGPVLGRHGRTDHRQNAAIPDHALRRPDQSLALLHRMRGVADRLAEMLAAMKSCDLHGGAMIAGARAYADAPDKTGASILTSVRWHIAFLASERSSRSLKGGWGLLKQIRENEPMTIYLRVPPIMLQSHKSLLRVWLGTIFNTVAERKVRPAIPDLFLVDEVATLGHLDELLTTAASLIRGFGLRTWTFWQSVGQIESLYDARPAEILDNAGTMSMFGASNASAANNLACLTGYQGKILGMPKSEQVIVRQGEDPRRAGKLNYLQDPSYRGLFDPNPFHAIAHTRSRGQEVAA